MTKRHLPIVTTSELKTFQRCQRMHHIRYTLGYKAIERAYALDFGTVVHVGLETWWATAGDIASVGAALAMAHSKSQLAPLDLVRADVMLCGYHARWIDEPITVLGVEHEFRVPIRHPDGRMHHIDLVGKFDALCTIDGRAYIPEHKTKSEKVDSESYFEQLRADMQVSNYLIAATELGHEPGGALYDVLVKPDEPKFATPEENRKYTKEGKLYARQRDRDESPEEYRERLTADIFSRPTEFYQRATVVRLDAELDSAREDLWDLAGAVYSAPSRSYHPRSPDACRSFGRACDYWGVCWGAGDLEDSTKYVKLSNPYEELSDATSPEE
jgi:PD-(D/E)XK nuclease superfamily